MSPRLLSVRTMLQRAFHWLSSIELGRPNEWKGPEDLELLRARVELLAELFDIVPGKDLDNLDEVIRDWTAAFGTQKSVKLEDLQAVAATALDRIREAAKQGDSRQRLLQELAALLGVRPSLIAPNITDTFDDNTRRDCFNLLKRWQERVCDISSFRFVPSPIKNEPASPVDEIYVDLEVVSDDLDDLRDRRGVFRPDNQRSQKTRVTIAELAGRGLRRCVVIGEPGSGKSTVWQWLTWRIESGQVAAYNAAISIRLREYAAEFNKHSDLSLVEFFIGQQDPTISDPKKVAHCLRALASQSQRTLLVLDGWDEVHQHREDIKAAIQRESEHFPTLVTSRHSGAPQTLFPPEQASYYELAGLPSEAAKALVQKQLLRSQQEGQFARVIELLESPQFGGVLPTNPLLLTLITRAVVREPEIQEQWTICEVYAKVAGWLIESPRDPHAPRERRTSHHDQGLRQLAYKLTFGQTAPRFTFDAEELSHLLPSPSTASTLFNSRLLYQPASDGPWSFFHATFQEYYAALAVADFGDEQFRATWDRALCSRSRQVVLSFLVIITARSHALSVERANYWLQNLDDRLHILNRLGCIVFSFLNVHEGCPKVESLIETLSNRLIAAISILRIPSVENAIEVSRIPAVVRLRIAETLGNEFPRMMLGDFVSGCPARLLRGSAVFSLLPRAYQDLVSLKLDGQLSPQLQSIGHSPPDINPYCDPTATLVEAIESTDNLSCISDMLSPLYDSDAAHCILHRASVISDIAISYSRFGVNHIIALVRGHAPRPADWNLVLPQLLSQAARTHPDTVRLLLRHIASLPVADPSYEPLLIYLCKHSVSHVSALLAELVASPDVIESIRRQALGAIVSADSDRWCDWTMNRLLAEPSPVEKSLYFQYVRMRGKRMPFSSIRWNIADTAPVSELAFGAFVRRSALGGFTDLDALAAFDEILRVVMDPTLPDCFCRCAADEFLSVFKALPSQRRLELAERGAEPAVTFLRAFNEGESRSNPFQIVIVAAICVNARTSHLWQLLGIAIERAERECWFGWGTAAGILTTLIGMYGTASIVLSAHRDFIEHGGLSEDVVDYITSEWLVFDDHIIGEDGEILADVRLSSGSEFKEALDPVSADARTPHISITTLSPDGSKATVHGQAHVADPARLSSPAHVAPATAVPATSANIASAFPSCTDAESLALKRLYYFLDAFANGKATSQVEAAERIRRIEKYAEHTDQAISEWKNKGQTLVQRLLQEHEPLFERAGSSAVGTPRVGSQRQITGLTTAGYRVHSRLREYFPDAAALLKEILDNESKL